MNAKKAKQLRRIAREVSGDRPARRIITLRPRISNPMTEARIKRFNLTPETHINDPESARGLYRALKKGPHMIQGKEKKAVVL